VPDMRELVDLPIAGVLPKESFAVDVRLYDNGGVLTGLSIGLFNRFMASISYGGENILGEGTINWNPYIGIDVRLRLIEENFVLPALVVGFNSQGYGDFRSSLDRYTIKSRGIYAVASRNYRLIGNFGIHFGANKSLEDDDGDDDVTFFCGADKQIFLGLSVLAEYDFATNDNESNALGRGRGYFNAGVRWSVFSHFYIEVDFKNLSSNKFNLDEAGREIKIGFFQHF